MDREDVVVGATAIGVAMLAAVLLGFGLVAAATGGAVGAVVYIGMCSVDREDGPDQGAAEADRA